MATPIPQRLLATLEKLDKATFETFQWNLMEETLEGFNPMSIASLEDASRHKTVSKMVQAYTKEGAMKITQKILENIGMIDLADKLKTEGKKGAQFVDDNMEQLVQRISLVMPIADGLYQKKMIHYEDYSEITAAQTSMAKMRKLYGALQPGGSVAKSAFYQILLNQQPLLVKELGGVVQK
ncbi:uncharacterized protein LOC135524354 isoform X2 [Oncorhynchus masou masou]|uniref:uncharacterized protein LOC135524354 isoform X2 n=1 Tax=Oncorhynchus masou masou TaxID=90313 RepID=UPI003183A652